jgi:hypothetical protein
MKIHIVGLAMTRFRVFLVAYLASYVLVTGIGLLLQLRPWEADTTNWVLQHPQIYIYDFLILQIPGLAVLPSIWFGSAWPELPILIFSILIAVWTWKNWRLPEKSDLLRKLGLYSYLLALLAVAFRLLSQILFISNELNLGIPLDIRNPGVTMAWISFQSTLMLTLVFVHLALRSSLSKRALPKK